MSDYFVYKSNSFQIYNCHYSWWKELTINIKDSSLKEINFGFDSGAYRNNYIDIARSCFKYRLNF